MTELLVTMERKLGNSLFECFLVEIQKEALHSLSLEIGPMQNRSTDTLSQLYVMTTVKSEAEGSLMV